MSNNLYEIVKSLQGASGSLAKQAILDANKDNPLFKAYMKAVYDVGINYYMKKAPKVHPSGMATLDLDFIDWMARMIAGRVVTGKDAETVLKMNLAAMDKEGQELVQYILDRKIGASVGDTMVLKTWPDLYFLPPYQRCSLLDAKARERFGKLKRFYVQTKADGSFAYVVKRLNGTCDVITRQGSKYPQWFAEKMAKNIEPGSVIVGELLVDEVLDTTKAGTPFTAPVERKTANGLLNSALKDGEKFDDTRYIVRVQAWDLLLQEEFEAGKSTRDYKSRFDLLFDTYGAVYASPVEIIETHEVDSLEEAFAIYQEHLQRGLEGCIIKDPDSLWKDGTAKDIVKLKIKFQVEMRCTGVYEGEGKAENKLGGIKIASEDGMIECQCGSGFNDKQRSVYWSAPDLIIGHVVTVEANDITQAKVEGKKPALSLPIFVEVRSDKTAADSAERIYAQLEAAKQGA